MISKLLFAFTAILCTAVVCAGTLLFVLARAADGYTVPQTTEFFSTETTTSLMITQPPFDLTTTAHMAPEAMRDIAFAWFGIRPQAREWMTKLPIYEANGSSWAGIYNLETRTVMISQPLFHVYLHEYAHANLHHKSFEEKIGYAAALLRLRFESAPEYAQYKELLKGVMSEARWNGQWYNPVQEFYAYAAQYSGGDLNRIPGYLKPFFADYLSPGANEWLKTQERTKTGRDAETQGLRMVNLSRTSRLITESPGPS